MIGTGKIIKEYKTIKPTKKMCNGCYDNYYNPGCWSFSSAKVCDKQGYININSNQTEVKEKTLTCWHGR